MGVCQSFPNSFTFLNPNLFDFFAGDFDKSHRKLQNTNSTKDNAIMINGKFEFISL